jgi:ribosomal protein L40E
MLGLNPGLSHFFLDNPELSTIRLHFILFYLIFYRNLQAPVAVLRPAQSGHEVRTVSGRWGGHIRDSLRWLFQGKHVRKCRKCLNDAWKLRWSHSKFTSTIIPRQSRAQMPKMFEGCLDAEVVTVEILSDDYSKVITGRKCRKCSNGARTLRWSLSRFSLTIIPR